MSRSRVKYYQDVLITGFADKGFGVGKDVSGEVLFVEKAVPGDVVDVCSPRRKKSVRFGYVTAYKKYSDKRVEPFCEHFGNCGGCKYQHFSYESQLEEKQKLVEQTLTRIGRITVGEFEPILGADPNRYYRNKLEFAYSSLRWLTKEELDSGRPFLEDVLGFHIAGVFDKVLSINQCHLQKEPMNAIRNALKAIGIEQKLAFYDAKTHIGFLRNVVIRITSIDEIMVIISFANNDKKAIKNYLDAVKEQFPNITSLYYCINTKLNDYYADLDMHLYYGNPGIIDVLGDVKFKIGPKSFFQTNTYQAKNMFDIVKEYCDFKGDENVYDLYTGLGSIALFVAQYCKSITGIEEIASAIDDANVNATLNGIENASFYAGDVKDILKQEFIEKHGKPDIVITDPPRVGMHNDVVMTLLELEAPKIVYVSCNPATQARDLNLLSEKYEVVKVRPVDMFPHTFHIESVALLQLKK
ncbi:MAG TPA: 23S rRNA (uracil(1939)-C(5))-methyltransferase RlmD [Saprospiraceae bacterium]|nr:23S rRNA (uracil(1939)-C(5))-methyltransferase RlmD [Saprospiraceae bacterium]